MTPEEINRKVAEKVMGWSLQPDTYWWTSGLPSNGWNAWDPYHRIYHAWMILEKFPDWTLDRLNGVVTCRLLLATGDEGKWTKGTADTAQAAICMAALETEEVCLILNWSSRVCERGVKGCVIYHTAK